MNRFKLLDIEQTRKFRTPCAWLIDRSLPMGENGFLEKINEGARLFVQHLKNNSNPNCIKARQHLEIESIIFDDQLHAREDRQWIQIGENTSSLFPKIEASPSEDRLLCRGFRKAFRRLEGRLETLGEQQTATDCALMFIISSGPSRGESTEEIKEASFLAQAAERRRIKIFAAVLGEGQSKDLENLSPQRSVLECAPDKIPQMFGWMANAVVEVSAGRIYENGIHLPNVDWNKQKTLLPILASLQTGPLSSAAFDPTDEREK